MVHAPKRLGSRIPDAEAVRQLDETFRFAREIGASTVVLHLWDLPEGDVRFDERLEAAVVAADIGERRGVRLAIETIPCLRGTPLENVRRVVEHDPRLVVALDTEFVSYHEELDAALDADWLWQHVQHIHIKDFDTDLFDADGRRRYLLPGDGAIDFAKVFEVLERRCFRGSVSLEASAYTQDGRPDVAALNHAISRMSLEPWRFA